MNRTSKRLQAAGCVLAAAAALGLAGCSTTKLPDAPKSIGGAAKPNPHYKVGAPYKIDGRWYAPKEDPAYEEVGIASWYGDAFHGRLTANGEVFDKRRLSAAHRTLPMPTLVEVENLENGRRIQLRVNDRGPFVGDRIIDLSHAAADALGFTAQGTAKVRVRFLGDAELHGLAALPGETPRRVAQANIPAATAAIEGGTDPLAALIERTAGPAPALRDAPPAASVEIWVEAAAVEDLAALKTMRLDVPEAGPVTVQSANIGGRAVQLIRFGPFLDEAIAGMSLARVQAAGFSAARIIRGVRG
jgi:rare lipoprotein A